MAAMGWLIATCWLCWVPGFAQEAPPRVALVVGNATHASLPALPACTASARAVAEALRALSFDVIERSDAGRGEFDAAIGSFARRLAARPGGTAFVYVCGYAVDFNGRAFLLPSSAVLDSKADVLTQGIIAKALQDSVARARSRAALLAFNLVAPPGERLPAAFGGLAEQAADALGLIAVTEPATGDEPTTLAAALQAELVAPGPEIGALLAALQRRLKAPGAEVLALAGAHSTLSLVPLPAPKTQPAAELPPTTVPREAMPAGTAAPTSRDAAVAPVRQASPARPAVEPLPDEPGLTDSDRRRIQAALAMLGYYGGRVDGLFGPETRTAIRRWQFEIRAETTGIITGAQATRLLEEVAR